MELKLAKKELKGKSKTITLEKIEDQLKKEKEKIYYFDHDNSHKDLVTLVDHFENEGYSVYLKEVRYGLDEEDFLYEIHIL
ncbi:MAG: hypothetical protein B6D59_04630 [Campylobacteraceae bacterium 4484_4]|nr:MAG: hypothetical protein B6D59_04630 [Campylobacteraceae bacterium 4484_4]